MKTHTKIRYRLQSRKILALIKESFPANLQKIEKASIDEVVSKPWDCVLPSLLLPWMASKS